MALIDWTGEPIDRLPSAVLASASGVIRGSDGRLLLQKRSDNGWWGLPGGKIEPGESVKTALRREVFEETGLSVRVDRIVGVYSDPSNYTIATYPGGSVVQYVNICCVCTIESGTLRGSDEGEVSFFSLEALPANLLLPHRIRIKDAILNSAATFLR